MGTTRLHPTISGLPFSALRETREPPACRIVGPDMIVFRVVGAAVCSALLCLPHSTLLDSGDQVKSQKRFVVRRKWYALQKYASP